jgi:hypothetical protein
MNLVELRIELLLCLVFNVGTTYCCRSWPGLSCKRDFNLNETTPGEIKDIIKVIFTYYWLENKCRKHKEIKVTQQVS